MKLSDLAQQTGARLERGDGEHEIRGAAGLNEATEHEVSFLANPRYTPKLQTTCAGAIFLAEGAEAAGTFAVLRAADPYVAYTRALRLFHPEKPLEASIHKSAVIDPSAIVPNDVFIGAHVVIGRQVRIGSGVRIYANVTIYDDVSIGAGSTIHSGVSIREGSQIGDRVMIQNNAVIGSDGFGYAKDEECHWLKIPQTGVVVIEDDVEIGAGTTIDRASVGETRIARGAKLDNLVQIGHSCLVGEDALICAQVGLAGSSRIGRRVILAGQVGVAGHLSIGDDAVLTAKSATSHDVEPGKTLSGIPAFDNREWLRAISAFRRLADMQRKVRALEARIAALEKSPTSHE